MTYAVSVAEVSATCACGRTDTAVVAESGFERYCAGEYVQVAFPEAPVENREVLIGWRSGWYTCPDCWALLGDGDD